MKVFNLCVVVGLIALASLTNPDVARAQNSQNCAWPIEISPDGSGNIVGPDDYARYWVMPFEQQYTTMTIKGTYPNARYFSYVAYNGDNNEVPVGIAGSLYDAQINPSLGAYTVVISRNSTTSGNIIGVSKNYAWVLLRIYVPNADQNQSGRTLMGGVPLPTITLTDQSGVSKQLEACPPPPPPGSIAVRSINKLQDLRAFLQVLFPPGLDLLGDEGTPATDRLSFAPPTITPMLLFPNPDNKYILMLPGNYQPSRIIVIHGKAPRVPSRGSRTVDMRYWSVCNNDFNLPIPTVKCTADLTTVTEAAYYTIVISDDLLRPNWLRPNVNWLPWGDELYPKLVFFRNMLSNPSFPYSIQNAAAKGCTFDFTLPYIPDRRAIDTAGQCAQQVMGDYYPVAVWCDMSTFLYGGWQACIRRQ